MIKKNNLLINSLKKEGCERFFEVAGASFLFASIYSEVYKDIGIVILNNKNFVSVNLSKEGTARTRRDGAKFFNNKKLFKKYFKNFSLFLKIERNNFHKIINQKEINRDIIKSFFNKIFDFYNLYRKTEFFYTDFSYYQAKNRRNKILRNNLKNLETLKKLGRKFLNKIFNEKNNFLDKFLDKICLFTKIKKDELSLYHYSELLSILDKKVTKDEVKLRKNNYILASFKKNNIFLKNKNFTKISMTYSLSKRQTITGVTVNKGKLTGTAMVIDVNFNNFGCLPGIIKKMNKGDILIAETTSPDFILACQKASAIITNQGGLGSHAAIISRELNIPCIVGTQNATKLIKTGDKLLVDADNGIIKIINRPKSKF